MAKFTPYGPCLELKKPFFSIASAIKSEWNKDEMYTITRHVFSTEKEFRQSSIWMTKLFYFLNDSVIFIESVLHRRGQKMLCTESTFRKK